ncbi:putative colanic acid biosynthesis acetyltransferase [Novosphingobium album (ex Liu et al. 2023)]|uniref:Colanic acid biosynthesis acetyltransferase n=1 Tax=Novosphingobium album (ex Liu et al. 2023) TaxID=3031130 RepID=A0ABT5WKA1_9SPHN|nr:putative colanic acid biosynthesis acetyltransferase [Novosphingobium album (ex Liu et al. 2023)]MDE8650481.1 putative colanic acid biosynthesis acetyltransferase [Novosphingobium album (ex Liu et al. 2023)]
MSVLDARSTGQHRGGASFSLGNRVFRLVWMVAWTLLAAWTPPPLRGWRAFVLRCFGARVGKGTRIYAGARVWHPRNLTVGDFVCIGPGVTVYCQGPISIGDYTVVSQGAHLCAGTHDIADPYFQLVTRPIHIGARAWIAAEAFVGPGVTVGDGAVLGARCVAMRDIEPWSVYSGNPARFLKPRVMRSAPDDTPPKGNAGAA